MKRINRLWIGIALATAVLQLLYLPTRTAGFVTDFTGLAERIETHGAAGIGSSFGFPALQPLTSFFYYLFYHYYSTEGWGWHLTATLLHTANAVLLFFLIRRLLPGRDRQAVLVAVLGALLFLYHPYASEVIVWRVGFHYLLVTFLIQAMLWQLLRWLDQPRPLILWSVLGLQIASLLTYELALVSPAICLIIIFWKESGPVRNTALLRIALPQWLLLGVYFLANRLLLGAWIGHYGSSVHLNFPWGDMTANIGRYFVKLAAFSRYWSHPWKESVATALRHPIGLILIVIVMLILLGLIYRHFRRANPRIQFAFIFGLAALIALAPVLNLYFSYLLHIENDRYNYLPALFFYPTLMALFSQLPRKWFMGLGLVYVLISVGLLHRTNRYWAQSDTVYRALLEDFRYYEQDTCYLLNLPDNLQGAPMFRDFSGQDRAFADALTYVKKAPYEGVLEEVVQYNMVLPTDGVLVESDSFGLKVSFNQWGNWWWRRGIGASSYRDTTYRFINEGHHYRLEWRKRPSDVPILYQDNHSWQIWRED